MKILNKRSLPYQIINADRTDNNTLSKTVRASVSKKLHNELFSQGVFIQGILDATNHLLINPNLTEAINNALAILGNMMEVDMVGIFENVPEQSQVTCANILFQWQNNHNSACNPLAINQINYEGQGLRCWYNSLSQNVAVHGVSDEFPESAQLFLRQTGLISILCLPIFIEQKWWGFIGFFDYQNRRHWSVTEQAILRDTANSIGATIQRMQVIKRHKVEHRQAAEQLKLLAQVVESTHQGVIITDKFAQIIWGNDAFTNTTGYSLEEVIGRNPRIFQSGLQHVSFYKNMWLILQQTGNWQGEIWNRRKNGEAYAEWITITSIADHDGEITHYVAVFSDITERKRFEQELREANEKLRFLSSIDGLTEVANRRYFDELYQREWCLALRHSSPLALIMIDIDNFKLFNDTYGHQQGDECLKIVAKTLTSMMKRPTELVARYGGEEFVIVLPQTDLEQALEAAEMLRKKVESLRISHTNSKSSPFVSISLGVASSTPSMSTHPEDLLRLADQALYRAKRNGGNQASLLKS